MHFELNVPYDQSYMLLVSILLYSVIALLMTVGSFLVARRRRLVIASTSFLVAGGMIVIALFGPFIHPNPVHRDGHTFFIPHQTATIQHTLTQQFPSHHLRAVTPFDQTRNFYRNYVAPRGSMFIVRTQSHTYTCLTHDQPRGNRREQLYDPIDLDHIEVGCAAGNLNQLTQQPDHDTRKEETLWNEITEGTDAYPVQTR